MSHAGQIIFRRKFEYGKYRGGIPVLHETKHYMLIFYRAEEFGFKPYSTHNVYDLYSIYVSNIIYIYLAVGTTIGIVAGSAWHSGTHHVTGRIYTRGNVWKYVFTMKNKQVLFYYCCGHGNRKTHFMACQKITPILFVRYCSDTAVSAFAFLLPYNTYYYYDATRRCTERPNGF